MAPNAPLLAPNTPMSGAIAPTRKLNAKEQKVFIRVIAEFVHLTSSDAEQLTQYAETVARYETAIRECKTRPTIAVPVVNRASGNITGEKVVRNPAFITVKEAQSQANALARRLMIDAHSAEKRQRLLTRKAQALAASEATNAAQSALKHGITEEQIQAEIERYRSEYIHATDDVLRQEAIWYLTVYLPCINDTEDDEDIYASASLI